MQNRKEASYMPKPSNLLSSKRNYLQATNPSALLKPSQVKATYPRPVDQHRLKTPTLMDPLSDDYAVGDELLSEGGSDIVRTQEDVTQHDEREDYSRNLPEPKTQTKTQVQVTGVKSKVAVSRKGLVGQGQQPMQQRSVKTLFHRVLAKESDQCDHIVNSIVSSSGAVGGPTTRTSYEPPSQLSSLHADYLINNNAILVTAGGTLSPSMLLQQQQLMQRPSESSAKPGRTYTGQHISQLGRLATTKNSRNERKVGQELGRSSYVIPSSFTASVGGGLGNEATEGSDKVKRGGSITDNGFQQHHHSTTVNLTYSSSKKMSKGQQAAARTVQGRNSNFSESQSQYRVIKNPSVLSAATNSTANNQKSGRKSGNTNVMKTPAASGEKSRVVATTRQSKRFGDFLQPVLSTVQPLTQASGTFDKAKNSRASAQTGNSGTTKATKGGRLFQKLVSTQHADIVKAQKTANLAASGGSLQSYQAASFGPQSQPQGSCQVGKPPQTNPTQTKSTLYVQTPQTYRASAPSKKGLNPPSSQVQPSSSAVVLSPLSKFVATRHSVGATVTSKTVHNSAQSKSNMAASRPPFNNAAVSEFPDLTQGPAASRPQKVTKMSSALTMAQKQSRQNMTAGRRTGGTAVRAKEITQVSHVLAIQKKKLQTLLLLNAPDGSADVDQEETSNLVKSQRMPQTELSKGTAPMSQSRPRGTRMPSKSPSSKTALTKTQLRSSQINGSSKRPSRQASVSKKTLVKSSSSLLVNTVIKAKGSTTMAHQSQTQVTAFTHTPQSLQKVQSQTGFQARKKTYSYSNNNVAYMGKSRPTTTNHEGGEQTPLMPTTPLTKDLSKSRRASAVQQPRCASVKHLRQSAHTKSRQPVAVPRSDTQQPLLRQASFQAKAMKVFKNLRNGGVAGPENGVGQGKSHVNLISTDRNRKESSRHQSTPKQRYLLDDFREEGDEIFGQLTSVQRVLKASNTSKYRISAKTAINGGEFTVKRSSPLKKEYEVSGFDLRNGDRTIDASKDHRPAKNALKKAPVSVKNENQSTHQSPMRSHPVLYLDLAKVAADKSSGLHTSDLERELETTHQARKEPARIYESKPLGSQLSGALSSSYAHDFEDGIDCRPDESNASFDSSNSRAKCSDVKAALDLNKHLVHQKKHLASSNTIFIDSRQANRQQSGLKSAKVKTTALLGKKHGGGVLSSPTGAGRPMQQRFGGVSKTVKRPSVMHQTRDSKCNFSSHLVGGLELIKRKDTSISNVDGVKVDASITVSAGTANTCGTLKNSNKASKGPPTSNRVQKVASTAKLGTHTQVKKSPRTLKAAPQSQAISPLIDAKVPPSPKETGEPPHSAHLQSNQQQNMKGSTSGSSMAYNFNLKNMYLPPKAATSNAQNRAKFITSSTTAPSLSGPYASLPKQATSTLPKQSSQASGIPLGSGTKMSSAQPQTTGLASKRRRVTDISFLKNGRSGMHHNTRASAAATTNGRSVSKTTSQRQGGNPTRTGFQTEKGVNEAAGLQAALDQEAADMFKIDPQTQQRAEQAFLALIDSAEEERLSSMVTAGPTGSVNRREKSRDRSAVRDRSGMRAPVVPTANRMGGPTNLQLRQQEMLEGIQSLQRKSEVAGTSAAAYGGGLGAIPSAADFSASNYTQVSDYRIGRHLGQGAYASVKMAIHLPTGLILAIKVYEKFNLMEQSRRKSVAREINVLKKLKHKNIMRLYDVIDTPKQLYLVMEHIEGTQLNNYLLSLPTKNQAYQLPTVDPATLPGNKLPSRKPSQKTEQSAHQSMLISQQLGAINSGTVSEEKAALIMSQLIQGLAYMHSRNVQHRDMKPENIIYNPETGMVKIIDFGFACVSKDKLRVFCGTPSYMSPEIVAKREYSGPSADIWACGVILFVLLTGTVPFKATTEKELFRKIQRGAYTYAIQTYAQMLASKMNYTSQLNGAKDFDTSMQPALGGKGTSRYTLGGKSGKQNGQKQGAGEGAFSQQMGATGTSTPTPPQQVSVSVEAKNLIRSLLTVNESQRPSAIDILLYSEWIRDSMTQEEIENDVQELLSQIELTV